VPTSKADDELALVAVDVDRMADARLLFCEFFTFYMVGAAAGIVVAIAK
jgi:hypothetical protein